MLVSPDGSAVKDLPTNAGDTEDTDLITGSVWKIPWRRKWQAIPEFLPEKSQRCWKFWATVQRVIKDWTQKSN